jgi:hypothetical protein
VLSEGFEIELLVFKVKVWLAEARVEILEVFVLTVTLRGWGSKDAALSAIVEHFITLFTFEGAIESAGHVLNVQIVTRLALNTATIRVATVARGWTFNAIVALITISAF